MDAALTFTELDEWLGERQLSFSPPVPLPLADARSNARLFPVEGGLVGTAKMDSDLLNAHVMTATGLDACRNVMQGIRSHAVEACLVELMACEGGCINGPVLVDQSSVILSRQRVMQYAAHRQPQPLPERDERPDLGRVYHDYSVPTATFSEEEIAAVLHRVDKYSPEDELDCGACGYNSCREKAMAVLRGMAEATMCIPYMRARAESLTNVVMDVTPNAIVIVDQALHIQGFSPSAERMFVRHRPEVIGRPLLSVVPTVADFVAVRDTGRPLLNKVVHIGEGLVVEMTIVPVGAENLMVAILRDVTEHEQHRLELERIRAEDIRRSQEVINKQMRVAHEIAGLLGETTAETKVLLTQLTRLLEETDE